MDGVEVSVMVCFINSCQCYPIHLSLSLRDSHVCIIAGVSVTNNYSVRDSRSHLPQLCDWALGSVGALHKNHSGISASVDNVHKGSILCRPLLLHTDGMCFLHKNSHVVQSVTVKQLQKELGRVDVKCSKGAKQYFLLLSCLLNAVSMCRCSVSHTSPAQ